MNVLMLSTDKNITKEGSAVRERMREYGTRFDMLHIIVHTVKHATKEKSFGLGSTVIVYPTDSWSRFSYFFDCVRIVKSKLLQKGVLDVDVVTAQDPETGLVGYILSRRYHTKFHLQLHADYFSPWYVRGRLRFRIQRFLLRFLLPRADGIRVVSKKIEADVLSRYPKLAGRVRVLPVYVDVAQFTEGSREEDLHRKYPMWKFIIFTAARFTREKNLIQMLRIFKRIHERYPTSGLLLVGGGPEEEYLRAQVVKMGLDTAVIFEPWQDDLASYYKTADLFLLTSIYEGYGRTLVEAVSAGASFVTSDVGVAAELSPETREISVCPVNDDDCFLDKITRIIDGKVDMPASVARAQTDLLTSLPQSKEAYLFAYAKDLQETLTA